MFWSTYFFYICYYTGGFPKHFRWPKVKFHDEESSPRDALTRKKRKICLAGKMRTYLWACPLTPTPQTHLSFPCCCKIKMRGSRKMSWIDALRIPAIIPSWCFAVMSLCFFVNQGVPSDEDLEWLFIRKKLHCCNESVGSNNMFWSSYCFYICYHAGCSTKHFGWPKVNRRDEESSPSDVLILKKRKTRLAGKMRTYLWACPLTPTPPIPSSFSLLL